MLTGFRAYFAMFVRGSMTLAFYGAGARERDAGRELGFQKLTVPDLVGARQDASGRGANRRAILVEPDAHDHAVDMFLRKARIGAGRADFHAVETGLDAAAEGVGMARLLRVRLEHGSDGNGGHVALPY
ncbi:hypothetical protein [Pseudorhodoplanes sp.]|uniref:hypothetical protein n=1 Tax=Pseudorhodoplanes sp. TaxID=1934341 RepID=UPI00391C0455